MFDNHLYMLVQEKEKLQYYFDKKVAMMALVRHIVNTKSVAKILVFVPDIDNNAPLKLQKEIRMQIINNVHYSFWLKFAFLDYGKDDVIEQPQMFFDTFEEIDVCEY